MSDTSSVATRELKLKLGNKISEYLKRKFRVTSYCESKDYPDQYEVKGSIQRYGDTTHLEVSVRKSDLQPVFWMITDSKLIMPLKLIGNIELTKDVCVSDPFYDREVWCMTSIHNLKPGEWEVNACIDTLDSWGERIYILRLCHSKVEIDESDWFQYFNLGVDSGQMSVIDDQYYPQTQKGTGAEEFYEKCCEITLSDEGIGLFYADEKAVGVVCSSGCGDGCYPMSVIIQGEEIVAIEINFM